MHPAAHTHGKVHTERHAPQGPRRRIGGGARARTRPKITAGRGGAEQHAARGVCPCAAALGAPAGSCANEVVAWRNPPPRTYLVALWRALCLGLVPSTLLLRLLLLLLLLLLLMLLLMLRGRGGRCAAVQECLVVAHLGCGCAALPGAHAPGRL